VDLKDDPETLALLDLPETLDLLALLDLPETLDLKDGLLSLSLVKLVLLQF
jgi:hypothetical protein